MFAALLTAGALAALPLLPPGTKTIELPREPVRPITRQLYASGSCAVIDTDLAFVAFTTDEGKSYRYLREPPALEQDARLYCHGDQLFLAAGGDLLRLKGDEWQSLVGALGTVQSRYRGVVDAPGRLYVGTGARIVVSTDGGAKFHPTLPGVSALASDGARTLAGKDGDVYEVGPDDALVPLSRIDKDVRSLGFAAGVWFAGNGDALFRSTDGGKSWRRESAVDGVEGVTAVGSTVIAHVTGGARLRGRNGVWSLVGGSGVGGDVYRAYPSASGVWIHRRGGYLEHVVNLSDPKKPIEFPHNPLPIIRAVAASGDSLVVGAYRPQSVYVSDNGGRQFRSACKDVGLQGAALDGNRLQLTSIFVHYLKGCRVPGLKTRLVPKLPEETCNGDRCVRFANFRLLLSKDRGKSWRELDTRWTSAGQHRWAVPAGSRIVVLDVAGTPSCPSGCVLSSAPGQIVAAAVAGREILVARDSAWTMRHSSLKIYVSVYRSTDDGKTFQPFALPAPITSFAPGRDGWYVGTIGSGLLLVPYAR